MAKTFDQILKETILKQSPVQRVSIICGSTESIDTPVFYWGELSDLILSMKPALSIGKELGRQAYGQQKMATNKVEPLQKRRAESTLEPPQKNEFGLKYGELSPGIQMLIDQWIGLGGELNLGLINSKSIAKDYRRLSFKYHPDRLKGISMDKQAQFERKFIEITFLKKRLTGSLRPLERATLAG